MFFNFIQTVELKFGMFIWQSLGANVNHKLFRGYATTATVREGHMEILEVLLNAGACQEACEEALLEASRLGYTRHTKRLMATDMIRPHVALRALVSACCRGFVDVVDTLIKVKFCCKCLHVYSSNYLNRAN